MLVNTCYTAEPSKYRLLVALFLHVGVALILHVVALCRICFLLQTQLTGFSAAHHVAWLGLMHCCKQMLHEPRRVKIFRRSAPFDEEMEEKTDEDEDEDEGEDGDRDGRVKKDMEKADAGAKELPSRVGRKSRSSVPAGGRGGTSSAMSSMRNKRLVRLWARLYADDDVANMRDVIDVD